MAKVLLLSEQTIKNNSIIEQNVDVKVLSKVAVTVQELQLKPVLGETLYNTLLSNVQSKIADSSYQIDGTLTTLLNDYVQPFLLYATLTDFISINNYKISNKGVLKLNDDAASNVSADELQVPVNYFKNVASQYKDQLIDYIRKQKLVEDTWTLDTDAVSGSIGWVIEPQASDFFPFGFPDRYNYPAYTIYSF